MAQVIMVTSGKGGTGKSTVSAFLALELAVKGHKTLLTETDTSLRSVDVISGVSEESVYDIEDVLSGQCKLKKALIKSHHTDNLFIIPSPAGKNNVNFEKLRALVNSVDGDYDYIIIDTPAGFDQSFYEAAKSANMAIVVCTADIVSVKGAREASYRVFDSGVKDIRLVINKYDKNMFKYSGFEDGDEIIDYCCAQLLAVVPYDSEIQMASMDGRPLKKESLPGKIFSAMTDRMNNKYNQLYIR